MAFGLNKDPCISVGRDRKVALRRLASGTGEGASRHKLIVENLADDGFGKILDAAAPFLSAYGTAAYAGRRSTRSTNSGHARNSDVETGTI